MTDFELRVLKEEEFVKWDEFVETSPQGSIFSSSLWLNVLNNAHDGKAEILGVFNKGELVSGILVFIRQKGPFKAVAYPPLTPFTSVLFREPKTKRLSKIESSQKDIINLLSGYLIKNYNYISLLLDPIVMDIRPFLWLGWKPSVNYTYEADLSNIGELWDSLGKDAKYEVNKGKKSGLSIKEDDDIAKFYNLYEKTFLKQNMQVPIKKDFICSLFNILQKENKCKLYFATAKEGIAASAIVIWDNKKAYYLLAASNPKIKIGAPSFLLWNMFEDMSKKFKKMDLVGANTQHIIKFKREFATRLEPYYSLEKCSSFFTGLVYNIYKNAN